MTQHVLTARQFNKRQLKQLFAKADRMRVVLQSPLLRHKLVDEHRGLVVATLFYEPSTRTRLSFESAAQRLGIGVVSTENASEYSSATKGETLEDTIRTVASYADAIVLRHKEEGAAEQAAAVSLAPIINAGDGKGEHPTQGLLDLYTIQREKGRLDNLHIVIGGDLAHGRTARSLAQMLGLYKGNKITFVSVPALQIGDDITAYLDQQKTTYTKTDNLIEAVKTADVIYWTRLQKERVSNPGIEAGFVIDQEVLDAMKNDAVILHPLPRTNEIHSDVDTDPRAAYFRQVENGLYIRMALLDSVLHGRAS
ncbi:MAG: Aspartate carbamoyltransferase [Candidatus Saccharibacteria bacterium]|nr:Aspartate carbamoyltransferase [Candidatus Saccharibacteria bacterium]